MGLLNLKHLLNVAVILITFFFCVAKCMLRTKRNIWGLLA